VCRGTSRRGNITVSEDEDALVSPSGRRTTAPEVTATVTATRATSSGKEAPSNVTGGPYSIAHQNWTPESGHRRNHLSWHEEPVPDEAHDADVLDWAVRRLEHPPINDLGRHSATLLRARGAVHRIPPTRH
jgi:hypothetical protein